MLITTNLDNYIMYDFREFEFSEITNMIVFAGIFFNEYNSWNFMFSN